MADLKKIEKKWQKRWLESKVFESNPDARKKFFATFPYPYMNAIPHLGHFYTMMRVEALARYKRMRGFNVLFPQGWHCTGSPIVSAAKRVEEGEEKQIKSLKDQGFTEKEIERLKKPEEWTRVFPLHWEQAYGRMGISYDPRRTFITTSLNPHYDKFIRWQFKKLYDKGYVAKGRHPVVWDPKTNMPVGDHDRTKGEGETPQEFVLLKFKFQDAFLIAATLRPETVFGQTNLWVGPEIAYVKAEVGNETWIVSKESAEKLAGQEKHVKILSELKGRDLLGKSAKAPAIQREIIILPSQFCNPNKGTGIVTSVPSDAPDDYIGLRDLWNNPDEVKKHGLDYNKVKEIKIIPIIHSSDLGETAAVKVVEEMKIRNQNDREKLEEAKRLVYKKGFYEGVMNKNCGKYSGMKVEQAKEKIKKELLENKEAELFYELTGEVISRSLTKCIVKVVSDQWFVKYGDEQWKEQVRKAFEDIALYPELVREQFLHTIGWINDWACAREYGLGTKLPFDEKWLIESLSDSTIYMAYYTIAHLIKEVPINQVDDKLFDYLFLSKGVKPKIKNIEAMKKEFEYWYPLDFRNSGKDLVQNHLTFFVFNHVAIFPKKYWPRGLGVNGRVLGEGERMSKSLGNMIPLIEMADKFGADPSRITILSGGESLDDPNWSSEFAESTRKRLEEFHNFVEEHYNKGRASEKLIDRWMENELNKIILDTEGFMERTLFRSALQRCFFDLHKALKWYLRRTKEPNKGTINKAIDAQILLLAPFAPHLAEELWEKTGKKGLVSQAAWPVASTKKPAPEVEASEEIIQTLLADIHSVLELTKISQPKRIIIFIADDWRYDFFRRFKEEFEKTKDAGLLIKNCMDKKHGGEIAKLIPALVRSPSKIPLHVLSPSAEIRILEENRAFLEAELETRIEVLEAEKSNHPKAGQASPGKPAILVE